MADGRHFENSFTVISQPEIIWFQRNLVCRCTLPFQGRLLNKIPKFCKFKMVDGRHIENRLLAISRRFIVRLTLNLMCRSSIMFRHRSRDQNSKFRKLKMADGPHFEMVLSLIIRFRFSLASRYIYWFREWSRDEKSFCKFKNGGRPPSGN